MQKIAHRKKATGKKTKKIQRNVNTPEFIAMQRYRRELSELKHIGTLGDLHKYPCGKLCTCDPLKKSIRECRCANLADRIRTAIQDRTLTMFIEGELARDFGFATTETVAVDLVAFDACTPLRALCTAFQKPCGTNIYVSEGGVFQEFYYEGKQYGWCLRTDHGEKPRRTSEQVLADPVDFTLKHVEKHVNPSLTICYLRDYFT